MTDALLDYYEDELAFMRQMAGEFSEKYPKVAGRLLLGPNESEDPHVERLIEAFQNAPDPLGARPFSALAAVLSLAATAADAGDLGTPEAIALSEADPMLVSHMRLDVHTLHRQMPSYASLTYSVDALIG